MRGSTAPATTEYRTGRLGPHGRLVRVRLPVDLPATLGPLRVGRSDPCVAVAPDGAWWRATRTPLGPATVRYAPRPREAGIRVEAWGPGAAWVLEVAHEALGGLDTLDGFDPPRGSTVREAHRRFPGLRVTRSNAVFEALLRTILAQKVTSIEAIRSYRDLVRAWGEPAPGPAGWIGGGQGGLLLPPRPERLAGEPYFAYHAFGIEMRRANAVRAAAARAAALEGLLEGSSEEGQRRLRSIPGVGAWTAAAVAGTAFGDPDAVPVSDYHLPNTVAWVFAGEPRADDARMLELLRPYAGHRGRVLRLLALAGARAPKFGPRQPLRSFRRL